MSTRRPLGTGPLRPTEPAGADDQAEEPRTADERAATAQPQDSDVRPTARRRALGDGPGQPSR
jgi:hypothetical protein